MGSEMCIRDRDICGCLGGIRRRRHHLAGVQLKENKTTEIPASFPHPKKMYDDEKRGKVMGICHFVRRKERHNGGHVIFRASTWLWDTFFI